MSFYDKLDDILKCKSGFLYGKLQDAQTENNIVEALRYVGINDGTAIRELVELYSWKDGIEYDTKDFTNLYNYTGEGVLLPLRFIKLLYDFSGREYWEQGTLPIIGNYKGDYLFFDTNAESDSYKMLLLYSKSALSLDPMFTYYDSVYSMVETNIYCFENKIFNYVDGDGLNINREEMYEISKKLNPKSQYWKQF